MEVSPFKDSAPCQGTGWCRKSLSKFLVNTDPVGLLFNFENPQLIQGQFFRAWLFLLYFNFTYNFSNAQDEEHHSGKVGKGQFPENGQFSFKVGSHVDEAGIKLPTGLKTLPPPSKSWDLFVACQCVRFWGIFWPLSFKLLQEQQDLPLRGLLPKQ